MNKTTILTMTACASLLSACGLMTRNPPAPVQPGPADVIEGTWTDPSGFLSTFDAGKFATRTTDSGQLVSSGTYAYLNDTVVQIGITSHLRDTVSKVNCLLENRNRLNCTSDSGSRFSLIREGAQGRTG